MTTKDQPIRSGEVGDTERGVTIQYDVFEYYMNFRVTEHEYPPDEEVAPNVMNGFVKWDGCSHFYFGDPENDGYLHLCGSWHLRKFTWAVEEVFRIAEREVPQFDKYFAGVTDL